MADLAPPREPRASGAPAGPVDARGGQRAEALRLPYDPLDRAPDDPALWGEAPLEVLVRFGCVPLRRDGARLVLAFGDLDDLARVDDAEFFLGRPIEAVVAPADRVAALLQPHRRGDILLEPASDALRLQPLPDREAGALPAPP